MSPPDIAVIVLGAALIIWELWYFLASRKRGKAAPLSSGVQEIRVVVRGGYEPDTIMVEAGRPVCLLFYRDETADCSGRVVFDDFGVDQELPAFRTSAIEFTPAEPGDYCFEGGTSTLKGRVVAQVGRDGARARLGRGHAKHA